MKKNNDIIDLFCGAGGLSKGFEDVGYTVRIAIDIWSDAIKTYNHNRSDKVAECKDITEISDEYFENMRGDVVGVIGGPPCQGFSTVGTRNVDDPRNKLYLQYYRVVKLVDPEFFVIENVKGLLTLAGGAFKKDILERFSKLGYSVKYEILNAADYGVPQNRKRVFFIGVKRGKKFEFPMPNEEKISVGEAISDLPSLENPNLYSNKYRFEPQSEYEKMMRKNAPKILTNNDPTKHTDQTRNIISMIPDGGKITDLPEEYWGIRKYNKAFQRMNSKLPSNTIDTGHRNYFHYKENRISSVRECARIQSFPDYYEFVGSKTSQYKQVGNAVPPLLAMAIANSIKLYTDNI